MSKSRGFALFKLAAKLGAQELQNRIFSNDDATESPVAQAKEIVKTLGQLKGAAMKLGQFISIEFGDWIPEEAQLILSNLHNNSPALPWSQIEKILKSELGDEKLSQLQNISPDSMASASIGQVHTAVLNNQKLALKIQYPGITESIDQDIKLLFNLFSTLSKLSGRSLPLEALREEVTRILKQEVDYKIEATFLERYPKELQLSESQFKVPKVFREYSSAKVLCMEFVEGIKADSWVRSKPSLEERNFYGKLFLDLYAKEFFEAGLVQTDPNFGNFFIDAKERRLVLLDFGAVRQYTPEFRAQYKELLKQVLYGTDQNIRDQIFAMELLSPKESALCQEALIQLLKLSLFPFQDAEQPFIFHRSDYPITMRQGVLTLLKQVKHSPPPHQIVFLHRKLGGIFHILRGLGCEIDLQMYRDKFIS